MAHPPPYPRVFNLIPPEAAMRLVGERPEFLQDERGMSCSGEEVGKPSKADLKEGEKELTGLRPLGRSFRKSPSFKCPHNYLRRMSGKEGREEREMERGKGTGKGKDLEGRC
jgi:hypothetical protein